MSFQMRVCAAVLVLLAGCGVADLSVRTEQSDAPFIAVSRGALVGGGDAGAASARDAEHFYVAIAKAELGKKWFLSGYLTQWYPTESEHRPVRSLGTRVVTFAVQNGKLFVFDATDGKAWSDVLDPTVVIEAYPIVTDHAPFNAQPDASAYVLFDPSAGQNRFDVVSDDFAASYQVRFEIDLSYLQRFRPLVDGASWEQVFTGYTELPGAGILAYDQPFRGSGTLAVTLRRYAESPDFQPTEFGANQQFYFPSGNWQLVKNEPRYKRQTSKWNIKPGMTPIPWRISAEVAALQTDPRFQGVDVAGAIERGVEDWNAAFGFPVFEVVPSAPGESPGDDDKNFVVVDRNPGAGLAFANWRENPNTGEIRGASVYFSSTFIASAVAEAADAGELPAIDAGPTTVPCAPSVVLSQVFGGGSTSGPLNQDFVELHNRTAQSIALAGWSVQYASAAGTTWQVVPLSGNLAPGGFFLVGLSVASDGGTPLQGPDLLSGVNLSATAGKVALVQSVMPLSGSCPAPGAAVDFVGYGGASCAEASPVADAGTGLAVGRRDTCADSDANAMDFVVQTPSPRNTATPSLACTCRAAAAPVTLSPSAPDAGSFTSPTARPLAHSISWQAMPGGATCALRGAAVATIPNGMTPREYVERVIEHTITHEIGHTLGLRHNFMGSLAASSVMDYAPDSDAALNPKPGPYDVAAVRYLYGLDANPPSQPFCTDESRAVVATCDVWDTGAAPLTGDIAPKYQAKMRALLAGTADMQYLDLWRVTRYVRGPVDEAQRLEAFNVLVADVAPPLKPEVAALGPNAGALADRVAQIALSNLFLDGAESRDELQVNPALTDDAFRARVIGVAKDVLVNGDRIRSFEARRVAIDVLKAMQHHEAYQALLDAKAPLAAERTTYNALGQAMIDDLAKRIDVQCSPYFVR